MSSGEPVGKWGQGQVVEVHPADVKFPGGWRGLCVPLEGQKVHDGEGEGGPLHEIVKDQGPQLAPREAEEDDVGVGRRRDAGVDAHELDGGEGGDGLQGVHNLEKVLAVQKVDCFQHEPREPRGA